MPRGIRVTPSARRLMTSLRDIGYDFPTAIADLVDNSVSAGASCAEVFLHFNGRDSLVLVADDGKGMTASDLQEALRFGTRREYTDGDLGRFGLGLKTASISQGRRLTVVSRRAQQYKRIASRVLDLDHAERCDRWEVLDPGKNGRSALGFERLLQGPGTVVIIDRLDRVLPERRPESGWARRRFRTLEARTSAYLGMVFHRLIEGSDRRKLAIRVNGKKVRPWNPFAPAENSTLQLQPKRLEVDYAGKSATVIFQPFVLPPRDRFSNQEAFEDLSGPRKWNRQQGLYIYRGGRMVQAGGWCGLRAVDEHTKLARAALEFGTELDELFRINVAKMRVTLPAQLKGLLERPIHDLCQRADTVYRGGRTRRAASSQSRPQTSAQKHGDKSLREVALALSLGASEAGESAALSRIMERVQEMDPEIARALGW